ncbi:MAG: hypothetical protein NTZ09_07355 [Candidatus Hydrogenedentes bacterium]|nr:hypothetical protein [Candidatus Hydrogenedentota bacterium]
MRPFQFTCAWIVLSLLAFWPIVGFLPHADAQEVPDKRIAAAKEAIKELRTKLDDLERLVDGLSKESAGEPNMPAAAEGSAAARKTKPEPVGEITWLKCREWWTYGGMKVVPDPKDDSVFVLNGTSTGGMGISKEGIAFDANSKVLVIRVLDLGQSNFTNSGRMLKVDAANAPLMCNCEQCKSEGDPSFVVVPDIKEPHKQGNEEELRVCDFSYDITGKVDSVHEKIVLAFYIADVNNLRVKVGLAKAKQTAEPGT